LKTGTDIYELLEQFEKGSTTAVARLISVIENDKETGHIVLDRIFSRTQRAYRIGFTGPPGAGKSTLVYQLSRHFRKMGDSIGIIAVDPTSPFSGGALLGDRIRMQELTSDPEIFVRSLASRGSLGGISACTDDVADLLDAFGKDLILIETVGVGQSELEIAEKAHTVVVILVPESGDSVQATKAGLMEIRDVFVMNKADHPNAEVAARELEDALRLKQTPEGGWRPKVVLTSAIEGKGIEALAEAIAEHRKFLESAGELEEKRRKNLRSRVAEILMSMIEDKVMSSGKVTETLDRMMDDVYALKLSPYRVVKELEQYFKIEE